MSGSTEQWRQEAYEQWRRESEYNTEKWRRKKRAARIKRWIRRIRRRVSRILESLPDPSGLGLLLMLVGLLILFIGLAVAKMYFIHECVQQLGRVCQ
jgi:ferric-dicitrate binding protein FerR (iron transport regulator)